MYRQKEVLTNYIIRSGDTAMFPESETLQGLGKKSIFLSRQMHQIAQKPYFHALAGRIRAFSFPVTLWGKNILTFSTHQLLPLYT